MKLAREGVNALKFFLCILNLTFFSKKRDEVNSILSGFWWGTVTVKGRYHGFLRKNMFTKERRWYGIL